MLANFCHNRNGASVTNYRLLNTLKECEPSQEYPRIYFLVIKYYLNEKYEDWGSKLNDHPTT
jgi:hypothetical protein